MKTITIMVFALLATIQPTYSMDMKGNTENTISIKNGINTIEHINKKPLLHSHYFKALLEDPTTTEIELPKTLAEYLNGTSVKTVIDILQIIDSEQDPEVLKKIRTLIEHKDLVALCQISLYLGIPQLYQATTDMLASMVPAKINEGIFIIKLQSLPEDAQKDITSQVIKSNPELYDTANILQKKKLQTFLLSDEPKNTLQWGPDSNSIAYVTNALHIFNAKTNENKKIVDKVTTFDWSSTINCIAAARSDKTIYLWDTTKGTQTGNSLVGHKSTICSVAFSPKGNMIVSSDQNDHVFAWDVKTQKKISELTGHSLAVEQLSWSPDGKYVAGKCKTNAQRQSEIIIWSLATKWDTEMFGQLHKITLSLSTKPYFLQWSPDSKIVAAGTNFNITFINASTGKAEYKRLPLQEENTKKSKISEHSYGSISWSPYGTHLAGIVTVNKKPHLYIWNLATEKITASLAISQPTTENIAWSADNKHIAFGSKKELNLVDVENIEKWNRDATALTIQEMVSIKQDHDIKKEFTKLNNQKIY